MSGIDVLLGACDGDHVLITVLRRERSESAGYWDGNWVECDARVRAGGFAGGFTATFRAEEFVRFREAVVQLWESLGGEATFETMEQQLTVWLVGNGRGGIALTGAALDQAGIGNTLSFHFDLDQTYLPGVISGLDRVIDSFPVVGSPSD